MIRSNIISGFSMQDNNYKNTFNYFNVQSNTNVKTDFSDFGSILYCDSYSVLHKCTKYNIKNTHYNHPQYNYNY